MSSTTESFVASIPDPPVPTNTASQQGMQGNEEPTTTTSESFNSSNEKREEILQLPPADPNSDIPKLQFGQALKLDVLGPIIINTDGTTRRIDNWDTLTEKEKEVTWRRIRKRNAERRELLEAKYKELSLEEQQQLQQQQEDVE